MQKAIGTHREKTNENTQTKRGKGERNTLSDSEISAQENPLENRRVYTEGPFDHHKQNYTTIAHKLDIKHGSNLILKIQYFTQTTALTIDHGGNG